MKRINMTIAIALAMGFANGDPAMAKNSGGHCPPGLAKKNPPCVPPGQAKKYYRGGDYLPDGHYDRIYDWDRYDLPRLRRGEVYYRLGDSVIRVKRDTREILQLIEAVSVILN